MQQERKFFNRKDLGAYLFVAGSGVLVQLVSGYFLRDWFSFTFENSVFPAYLISMVAGFTLTKLFAFNARNSQQTNREMLKYLSVALFSGFVTWGFSLLAYEVWKWVGPDVLVTVPGSIKKINFSQLSSNLFGMGCSFLSNYVLHKSFTFKSSGLYDRMFKNEDNT